jgi:hypothetical protein
MIEFESQFLYKVMIPIDFVEIDILRWWSRRGLKRRCGKFPTDDEVVKVGLRELLRIRGTLRRRTSGNEGRGETVRMACRRSSYVLLLTNLNSSAFSS